MAAAGRYLAVAQQANVRRRATVNSNLAVSPHYDQDHTLFTTSGLANGIGAALLRSRDSGDTWKTVTALEYINGIVLHLTFRRTPAFTWWRPTRSGNRLIAVTHGPQNPTGIPHTRWPCWRHRHHSPRTIRWSPWATASIVPVTGAAPGRLWPGRRCWIRTAPRAGRLEAWSGQKADTCTWPFRRQSASPLPTPRPGLDQQRQGTDMDTASGGARSAHQHAGDGAKCRRQRRGALYGHLRRQRV